MTPLRSDSLPVFDDWGVIDDLGAEILEGDCIVQGSMISGTPETPVSCGFFAVSKGKFRMTFPSTEHAIVLEGSVTLTEEATGVATTYSVGEGWFIEKGTTVLWDVHSDRVVKNYLAVA